MDAPQDLRPQFHFTAPKGWLNDPNGLVYRDGIYHLFYQHNPFGTEWGNMTWGHATSPDLIHWKNLPNALEPDALGTMFSGSAVVDRENTAGFGENAIVCFYTAAGGTNPESKGKPFTQCLAWSSDGKTFHKFKGNPVVPHIDGENRDPKVFWHWQSKKWVMVLYLSGDTFCILGSKNLREWHELSRYQLKGASECPDLFMLGLRGVDSARSQLKWIFWAANGTYQVGRFDGVKFVPETEVLNSKWGNTGYAAQTYNNLQPLWRVVQVSWFNGSNFPGCPWNQQLGFPNELGLRMTPSGPRLTFMPVDEIYNLERDYLVFKDRHAESATGLLDFEGKWTVPKQGNLELNVNGHPISVDAATGVLTAMGSTAKIDAPYSRLSLRILADRTSLEIYAQDGLVHGTFFVLPKTGDPKGMSIKKTGEWVGEAYLHELRP